jgi:hypothetical protein
VTINTETSAGEPVFAAGIKIVPFARSVRWQNPMIPVGFVWNRAVSVLAIYPDGREQILPVRDVTRRIQLTFLGIAAIWGLVSILFIRQSDLERRKANGR